MSNGNAHETINFFSLSTISILLIVLGYISIHPILAYIFFIGECILFWIHAMFHTYYVTPDNDTHSKSTKRLGILGKLIDAIFSHHGLLHNPYFWVAFYVGVYWYVLTNYDYKAWWLLGGTLALLFHIFVDFVSHGLIVTWGKIKRCLNPFRWIH